MRYIRQWLGYVLLTSALVLGEEQGARADTAMVPVNHRLPEEIAQVIRSLLEPREAVVPVPSGVVVKASSERIGEIRELVGELDRRLKRLTITLLQSDQVSLDELNAEAGIAVKVPSEEPVRARAHVYRSLADASAGTRQHLQTLEGHPAFILVGLEQPIPVIGLYGHPPVVTGGIDYRPVTTGFRVVPKRVGCRVRLTVSPWSQRMSDEGGGRVDVQAAGSTVEMDLGRWIELGANDEQRESSQRVWLGYQYATRRRQTRIYLKVESPDGC